MYQQNNTQHNRALQSFDNNTGAITRESTSKWQMNSLFTLRVWYKSKKARSFHSWKQEIRPLKQKKVVDHHYAYNRMLQLLKRGEDFKDVISAMLYCNLTDTVVAKRVGVKVLEPCALQYWTNPDSGAKYLMQVKGLENTYQLIAESKAHSVRHWEFYKLHNI